MTTLFRFTLLLDPDHEEVVELRSPDETTAHQQVRAARPGVVVLRVERRWAAA